MKTTRRTFLKIAGASLLLVGAKPVAEALGGGPGKGSSRTPRR